jgi:hypothetical protein
VDLHRGHACTPSEGTCSPSAMTPLTCLGALLGVAEVNSGGILSPWTTQPSNC